MPPSILNGRAEFTVRKIAEPVAGSVRLEAIRRPYVAARAQPVGQVGWSGGNAERPAAAIAGSRRPASAMSRVRADVSEGLGW